MTINWNKKVQREKMILYHLLITPIEYIIEVVFTIMNKFLGNSGYAIVAVSITISTLVLPLYLRADKIQEEEQKKQKDMELWVSRIRSSFSGDERFMRMNAYYAQEQYRPLYALRGVIPLLLQIPFFIAAYHFLSNLQRIQGVPFGIISDLGAEDQMLKIGGIALNLLPILMTAINMISTFIYTKGFSWKQKAQPYLLALVFLVLLYRSPSGLVLYWTMNNLYSLCKNLVIKRSRDPKRIVAYGLGSLALVYAAYLIVSGKLSYAIYWKDFEILMLYFLVFVSLFVPLLGRWRRRREWYETPRDQETIVPMSLIILEEALLTVLIGAVIPLNLIEDSPMDFMTNSESISPLHYAGFTLCVAAGFFLIWGSLICCMLKKTRKGIYGRVLFILSIICIINTYFFRAEVGNISTMLEFEVFEVKFSRFVKLGNLVLLMLVAVTGRMIWAKISKKRIAAVVGILLTCMVGAAGIRTIQTEQKLRAGITSEEEVFDEEHRLHLSRTGKNVIVLMLDRAVNWYTPFMFEEKPELVAQFDGFIYYPNTASFGRGTRMTAPALFGGYEYSPWKLDQREDESIYDKHDEAIKVMPRIFNEEGYEVTCVDIPYAGGQYGVDMSTYNEIEGIRAFRLEGIVPAGYDMEEYREKRERNFFFYSLFVASPPILQDDVYDGAGYFSTDREYRYGTEAFRNSIAVLDNLSDLTIISEEDKNTFLMMDNNTTHEPTLLSLPNYDMEEYIDYELQDIANDRTINGVTMHFDSDNAQSQLEHYHVNMAAMLALGRWFDWLRNEGIYDNTRIILVADHGATLGQFDEMLLDNGVDIQNLNPLLMYKDFNAEDFETDWSFMTNADTPILAMEGIIENMINPYSGEKISNEAKWEGINILWAKLADINDSELGMKFDEGDLHWFHVTGEDLFDEAAWEQIK